MYRITFLVGVLLIAAAPQLNAQGSVGSRPLRLEFSIEPATRLWVTPTLVGILPGCPPRQARMSLDERGHSGEVFIFDRPEVCTRALVESRLRMARMFFPTKGIYRIRVMDEHGLVDNLEVAVFGLVVNGEIGYFGKYSVAGAWYDPNTPGSGLILSHSRSSVNETVFGTWSNFDSFGAPQWHSLEGELFAGSTTLLGSVYRSRGASCGFLFECASALIARPQVDIVRSGSFRFVLESATQARLTFETPSGDRQEVRLQKLL